MTGRCFSSTCLPLRHRCRISNLAPHAGVHRLPEHASAGPAALTLIFPPQGQPLSVQPAARLVASHPGCDDRGGATSPRRRRAPIQTPVAASLVAALLPAGAPGGHVVERVGSDVTASFLHLVRRPAKNAAQHFAKSFGSVAPSVFGSAHGFNHDGVLRREVVNPCREFGNVCRA